MSNYIIYWILINGLKWNTMSKSQSYFISISWSIHTFHFESPILKMNVHFSKKNCNLLVEHYYNLKKICFWQLYGHKQTTIVLESIERNNIVTTMPKVLQIGTFMFWNDVSYISNSMVGASESVVVFSACFGIEGDFAIRIELLVSRENIHDPRSWRWRMQVFHYELRVGGVGVWWGAMRKWILKSAHIAGFEKPEASTFKYLLIEPAQHLFFFFFSHNLQGQFYSWTCTGLTSRSADFVHDLQAVAF